MEMSAAAPPPTPLKMATSWGIAVILTKRATGTAMAAPRTMAMIARTRFFPEWRSSGSVNVMPTARVAAAAPTRLPVRACLGELRNLRARMKPMMATRYASSRAVANVKDAASIRPPRFRPRPWPMPRLPGRPPAWPARWACP